MGNKPLEIISNNSSTTHTYFHTTGGGIIEREDNYSDEFYNQLNDHITRWVLFPKGEPSITSRLTEEEQNYIISHMIPSENNLTRVELQSDTFDKNSLEVGKEFEFNAELKSFSRTQSASRNYIKKNEKFNNEDIIIFRTPKGTMQFNVTNWERENVDEMESVVLPNSFVVDKITDISDDLTYVPYEYEGNVKLVDIIPAE